VQSIDDPEIRERHSQNTRNAQNNDERKAQFAARIQKLYQDDPEAWALRSKIAWEDEELREEQRERMEGRWKDPEYRDRVVAARRKAFENPELRQRWSDLRKKEMGERPDLRQQRIDQITNPEVRARLAELNSGDYPSFTAPDGTVHPPGKNQRAFAREHGMSQSNLRDLIKGKIKHLLGWTVTGVDTTDRRARLYPSFRAPDGTLYPPGRGLATFCRQHDLSANSMLLLCDGKIKTMRGWTLADPPED